MTERQHIQKQHRGTAGSGTADRRDHNRRCPAAERQHLIHCLNIIGQVEGHNTILPEDTKTTKYEHVLSRRWSPLSRIGIRDCSSPYSGRRCWRLDSPRSP